MDTMGSVISQFKKSIIDKPKRNTFEAGLKWRADTASAFTTAQEEREDIEKSKRKDIM